MNPVNNEHYHTDINVSPNAHVMLFFAATVAAICGGLYGYDTGIISGALLLISGEFHLSNQMQEIVTSSILFGAVIGALGSSILSDRYGRRSTTGLVSAVFLMGAISCALAGNVYILIVSRVFLGLAVGSSTQVVPMYISELAPAERRGTLVTMFNVAIGIGILSANIVGFTFHTSWGWRPMIGLAAFPAAVVFVSVFFLPKSPRWTAEKEGMQKAIIELARIRTSAHAVRQEILEMQRRSTLSDRFDSGWKGLFSSRVRPALVAALGVAFFTQCGGLEMIIYYSPTFLRNAGFGSSSALLASLGVGVVYCLMTIIGCLIVDRVGRRRLMLLMTPGSVISLLGLGLVFLSHPSAESVGAYLVIFFLLAFMATNSLGIQVCGWLLGAELFPLSMRSQATSVHAATLWGSNLIVTGTALTLVQEISLGGTMWFYATINMISLGFIYFFIPETSGASLEDIEKALCDGKFHPTRERHEIEIGTIAQ